MKMPLIALLLSCLLVAVSCQTSKLVSKPSPVGKAYVVDRDTRTKRVEPDLARRLRIR